jgi:hypothetical protein
MDDSKNKLKEFVRYYNAHPDERNVNLYHIDGKFKDYIEPAFIDAQKHIKLLTRMWNNPYKPASFMWDIKKHHTFISSYFMDRDPITHDPTHPQLIPINKKWYEYIISTQHYRLFEMSKRSGI